MHKMQQSKYILQNHSHNIIIIAVSSALCQVDDLNCSICLEFMINCKIAVCGHTFCEFCISEWLIRKKVPTNYNLSYLDLSCMSERYQKAQTLELLGHRLHRLNYHGKQESLGRPWGLRQILRQTQTQGTMEIQAHPQGRQGRWQTRCERYWVCLVQGCCRNENSLWKQKTSALYPLWRME